MEEGLLDDAMQYEGLQITAESRMYLAETAQWAKFLAIVGFVFMGLMVLIGLFFGSIMGGMMASLGEEASAGPMGAMGGFMGIMYVFIALIYFFPCYYLLKFANQTKAALANNDAYTLTDALKNQKSVYKFMGIFMIIILGFYVLGIIAAIIGSAATAF